MKLQNKPFNEILTLIHSAKQKAFAQVNSTLIELFYEIYNGNEKVSALLTQLIWTNHLLIISSSKSDEEREFYLLLASQAKYSTFDEYFA